MKRNTVLSLFFNESTKHWHFKEILVKAGISRPQAAEWLKKLVAEKLVLRIKEKGKMPYYIANNTSPVFQMKKRVFALDILEQSGFLAHLASLPGAEAVYVFGSMSRWDWYTESDIDVFVYGNDDELDIATYETALHREIQVFVCHNPPELKEFNQGLLHNIIKGYRIKGDLHVPQT
jgi:predicted nucleotidyltransferase